MSEKKRGVLTWWSIPEKATCDSETVNLFGLSDREPRNDSKAAIVKAIKAAKREFGWSEGEKKNRMNPSHLSPTDTPEEARWEIHKPEINAENIVEWKRLAKLVYSKKSRSIDIDGPSEIREFILAKLPVSSKTLDNVQIARIVKSATVGHMYKSDCFGITMRAFGGIYFVDEKHQSMLDNVGRFLEAVGGTLYKCGIYQDSDSTLEEAASREIINDLSDEIEELKKVSGSLTGKRLDTRIEKIKSLREKALTHCELLRDSYHKIESDISTLIAVLEKQVPDASSDAVSFNLDNEINALLAGVEESEKPEVAAMQILEDDLVEKASDEFSLDDLC